MYFLKYLFYLIGHEYTDPDGMRCCGLTMEKEEVTQDNIEAIIVEVEQKKILKDGFLN